MNPIVQAMARIHAIAHVTASVEAAARYVPVSRHDELTVALARVIACIADTSTDDAIRIANEANANVAEKRSAKREGMS